MMQQWALGTAIAAHTAVLLPVSCESCQCCAECWWWQGHDVRIISAAGQRSCAGRRVLLSGELSID